jgi:basic amino acid/polyamine antiporter, APA family
MALKKSLGALDVFCIAAGAMISSGLFVLPSVVYVKAGPSIILAYLLAGLLMVPSALAKCELATAMPKAGGTYFFVERSLGSYAGTLVGFSHWFSISFKSAFALVGMGVFAGLLLPESMAPEMREMVMRLTAAGCCVFFVALNIISVKHTGRFQVILVMALLAMLAVYVGASVPHIDVQNFTPFMTGKLSGLLAATGMVFISYGGLTKVASVSEEVRQPGRNIPLGMLSAFVIVGLLYVLVVAGTVGVGTLAEDSLDVGALAHTPISDAAGRVMGPVGAMVLAIAGVLAFITTANAGILAASREPMAMSRDRLVPGAFAQTSRRFGTPHFAILCTGAFILCVVLFLRLDVLVKTASTLMLILFVFVNVSLIVMRASGIHSYRPKFRCPGYPWMQIFAILAYGVLIAKMGRLPLLIAGGFVAVGTVWYLLFVRERVRPRSALVHIVERIVDRRIGTGTLGSELKDILLERDNIVEDRFDRLIKECPILDIEGPTTYEEFFKSVARATAGHLHADATSLHTQLVEREKESTTAIAPGLAIPHVIIQGTGQFDILLARCQRGIIFQDDQPPVHTVFVLLGTRDERSFHLKSLMWIAQIAQSPDFRKRWMNARDVDELRDIVLLAARDREVEG